MYDPEPYRLPRLLTVVRILNKKRKTKGSELTSLSKASIPSWCQQIHIFPIFLLLSLSSFPPLPTSLSLPLPSLSSGRMHFYVFYLAVLKCSILHSFSCQFWWHFINWTAKADDPSHLHGAQLHYLSLHRAKQVAQLSQRPRCRWVSYGPKVEDWNWETIFTDNIGLYSTTAKLQRFWPAKKSKSGKKCKIRAITPFKVIQGHRDRYQLKAHMRFPISD